MSSPGSLSGELERTRAREMKGLLIVVVAVIWQGTGTAVVGATVPPALATFTTFGAFLAAAALAATVFVLRRRRAPTLVPKLSRREMTRLNLYTAGAFGAFYVAATLIPPTAASVIETGVGPLSVALAAGAAVGRRRGALFHPALVLAISVAVAWFALGGASRSESTMMMTLGIVLSAAAGCCAAGVLLSSHRLSARGVGALQISTVRFHLAWAMSGLIAVPQLLRAPPGSTNELWSCVLVGVTCIAGPILVLQWGITMARPLHAALVISALPAVVLGTDLILHGTFVPVLAAGMLLLVTVSVVGVLTAPSSHS